MKKYRIKSKNILNSTIKEGFVYFQGGVITDVTQNELDFDQEINVGDNFLSAGFIDCHTHGAFGHDFSDCDADGVVKACNYHFMHGTTAILPTTLSLDKKSILLSLENVEKAMKSCELLCEILGAHLEGPYFSPVQAGAQNPDFITEPIEKDYIEIIKRYGGIIKKWSYAPERDANEKFFDCLSKNNIVASVGHSNATFDQLKTAIQKGLKNVTHLYSCTSTITRDKGFRHLGVVETAYLCDDFFVELIADGKHVPADLIKLAFKLKGANKIMLVTDSLPATGSGEARGNIGGIDFIIEDGVAKLSDRSAFAGSVSTMDVLIKQCVGAGVSLNDAVLSATKTPADSLGIKKGRIEVGYDADFVIFDKDINVLKVISKGRI